MKKKIVIGITAPLSVVLIGGQLEYFVQKGYEVYLMAPKDKKTENICKQEGAILLPVAMKREISLFNDLVAFFSILFILIKLKPDIVNFGTPKVSLLGMVAAKIANVKGRIYTCRGFRFEHEKGIKRKILIFMEKVTSNSSNKVVCISPSVRDFGVKLKIFKKDKTVVINKGSSNGLDLDLFNPDLLDEKKLNLLKEKYNPTAKFVFGFLGRVVERKGFFELFKSFEKMYKTYPDTKLLVVGSIEYNQMDGNLIKEAEQHPGVEFVDFVDLEETPYYYSLMDVFVLPAYWEGFGNVLIQAAAMGIPVISTDVNGCKDAVSDGFNGRLVKAKDVDSLFLTMKELYSDSLKLLEFSKNGPKWAENFKSDIIWEGLHNLYAEISAERK